MRRGAGKRGGGKQGGAASGGGGKQEGSSREAAIAATVIAPVLTNAATVKAIGEAATTGASAGASPREAQVPGTRQLGDA